MMTRRGLGCFAVAAGMLLGACKRSSWIYRYRLAVEVETPEGPKTGSGVIEVRRAVAPWPLSYVDLSHGAMTIVAKGEAVVIDLGARGLLFALLVGQDEKGRVGSPDAAGYLPAKVFLRTGALRESDETQADLETLRAYADLAPAEIPFLVRFRDIDDPRSVEKVDPNDLAASFGPGVRLLGASIEMTGDPVTTGIEKQLGWLAALKGGYLDGQFTGGGPALSNILHGGNFKSSGGQ